MCIYIYIYHIRWTNSIDLVCHDTLKYMSPSLSVFQLSFSLSLYNQDKIEKLIHNQSSKMKRSVAQLVILCLMVSCTIGETKAVRSNSDGSEAWGYVEVRPSTSFISHSNSKQLIMCIVGYMYLNGFVSKIKIEKYRSTHVLVALQKSV